MINLKFLESYKTKILLETHRGNINIGVSISTLTEDISDIVSLNNVYDFIKTYGFILNILSPESKKDAKLWLDKNEYKYDDIIFVDNVKDKWETSDIVIDDNIHVINSKPLSKVCIKKSTVDNINSLTDINVPSIKYLTISIIKTAISKLK